MSLLDAFSTEQQNQQSPSYGTVARVTPPTIGEAFAATKDANDRLDGMDVEFQNQRDFMQQRVDAFSAKSGVAIPPPQITDATAGDLASTYGKWLGTTRDRMQTEAQTRNDPTLAPPTDQEIAAGGIGLARAAVRRQSDLSQGPGSFGSMLGSAAAGGLQSVTDPLNIISLAAAPEGGAVLASALRMGGAMAAQTGVGDALKFGYRRQVNPDYGVGDVAGDVAGAFAGGALFGAGHALGGEGMKAALGAAAGGAVGGAALGAVQGGGMGALQGAIGGAALPLAGAGFGLGAKTLGMSWRVLRQTNPDLAASMPLEVRDAGTVAEKAGDIQAQNPFTGPAGEAAHGEAVGKIESDLLAGRAPELPQSAQVEAAARRGQVFYPGGAIDVRYDLAEHADIVTSHDADFNVNPDYPAELQPRDRSGAPARDQVNTIAANLEPDRLGPSPEANSGAPIVGPDGVVESGNGRALAIGQAYDQGGGAAGRYRAWLEQQGYDTSGFDKPVLVGMRETPMDAGQRADFAHAANGSASLRMSATEQAMSDARLIDSPTLDLAKSPDLAAAANRDLARAFVAKLPQGERGGLLTRDGGLSAGGVRRMQAAMTARAYGDPGVLSRAFDHPDPNIKAIAGALTDAAGPWAQMRDAATRGDIASGHDITGDMLQSVKAIMRARDEGRPAWEVLNQGDIFQSDTTQLATRMFFRDEAMRQPAGRARVAEALTSYATEAAKNTTAGRLFNDAVSPGDVLRRAAAATVAKVADLLDTGAQDVLAMIRAYHGTRREFDRFDARAASGMAARSPFEEGVSFFTDDLDAAKSYGDRVLRAKIDPGKTDTYDATDLYNNDPAFLEKIVAAQREENADRDPDFAERYAREHYARYIESERYRREMIQASLDAMTPEERAELQYNPDDLLKPEPVGNASGARQAIMREARARGLDTVRITGLNDGGTYDQIAVLNPKSIRSLTDKGRLIDVMAMARRAGGSSPGQMGFDFGALPERNPLIYGAGDAQAEAATEPTSNVQTSSSDVKTSFQSKMYALADASDRIAREPAFGEMTSGNHQAAYERHRALAGAVKEIAKAADGVFSELARVGGEDVDHDGNVWGEIKDGLHSDLRENASEMRSDMRDPDLVGEQADRPHIDVRDLAGQLSEDLRSTADASTWIDRERGDDRDLHPDDLDALAEHTAAIASRLDELFSHIETSARAEYPRVSWDSEERELREIEKTSVADAVTVADDLRAKAADLRESMDEGDLAPRIGRPLAAIGENAGARGQDALTLRNLKTGETAQAQNSASLRDAIKAADLSRAAGADPIAKLAQAAIGPILGKAIGDMKVYTVGPAEMRTLAEGRMKIAPGYEPAGFFDPRAGHIVVLDDAMRNSAEASQLLVHEGLHGAFMRTINESDSARAVIDHLRNTAGAAHLDRGGDVADHYGLTNAHEFVSEAFSNPEFQRFLASIPADDRLVKAFGLDSAPGNSLWDAFVGAVRKILGLAPDQHTLLDAAMRTGKLLEQARDEQIRGDPVDLAPSTRLADPAERAAAAEASAQARAFADAKDAISYRINSDRIAQHPNGPLAGFLGILTRDIHEKGGINVESVAQDYEGRMASHMEAIVEPYGSKMAGLKQDLAGIRDVVREIFGVDTKNATAKVASEAWGSLDKFATTEAKRLGKVFTAAEDWRVPQFWESRRAQKFGKRALMADMQAEIDRGGLKVFDPDTGEEANVLRRAEIVNGAADKIVTDASMGGTPGASGSFRTDMRVFRFADGAAGADGYLRLMDKYGAGQGGYLHMLEAHVGKVSRELGLARVLGPGWADTGEKLLQDALLADKTARANAVRPEGLVERLRALPGATGKFLMGWLESPAKAEAVWHYMSGQASGVGSELMAGLLSETRAFMTATRMGSALVTAVPADAVNWLMAARHNGMDMGRMVSAITGAFLKDNPERREEAARLGITAHAGADAAIGTKRFGDQAVGEKMFARMANFVIRAQGLHAWDSAIRRAFPMEFLGTIAQRGGKAFGDLDEPFGNFLRHYGFNEADWSELSKTEHALDTGGAKFLHPDNLPEPLRVKLMSAIYDERQFAYLAGGSTRVKAISAQAKAGTLPGELARSVFLFKSFPMSMLATWGMRAAREAGTGKIGTLATLVTGMTMAGALAMQARSLLQGKDPRNMKDPYFWGESFLQGGAAGIYGDFFKEAFSRSDTSLTETMMGPLAAFPAGIQGLTSGVRRIAEDGEKVNFGAKLSRLISQNTPGGNLWYSRLITSRLLFDNVQRMIDRDYAGSFARQQQRSLKTNHQGYFWAPGQNAPSRAPDLGAAL